MACTNNSPLTLIYGDVTLGIRGSHNEKPFHYIFSYAAGGMESLVLDGKEWLYRVPRPTFWRALTDNDRGSKFHLKSGMWLAADMFITCKNIVVTADGRKISLPCAPENNRYTDAEMAETVRIVYTYETITKPATNVTVAYEIERTGEIQITVHYHGNKELPELPVFGMRFVMPTCADRFVYEGLSGETYPDRKEGGVPGVYETEGPPVTPYLVPQDCGVHMDTKWLEIYRSSSQDNCNKKNGAVSKLRLEFDNLAFSCLPYTAEELENATHQEELPPARRTVLCVYGAVRGVGGIDSWGSDVESEYHIDAGADMEYSFRICGVGETEK